MPKKSRKWSSAQRTKFLETMRIRKNHKKKNHDEINELEHFLDGIWNMLTLRQKREVIVSDILENLHND